MKYWIAVFVPVTAVVIFAIFFLRSGLIALKTGVAPFQNRALRAWIGRWVRLRTLCTRDSNPALFWVFTSTNLFIGLAALLNCVLLLLAAFGIVGDLHLNESRIK